MRLFIAEKPSLARAIADVLPKPHQRGDGFIKCGDNDVVTWCRAFARASRTRCL